MTVEEYGKEIRKLRPILLKHALKYTHNMDRAEDLVQDALMNGYRFLDRFLYGSLLAWLTTIMTRTHFTNYRKRKRTDFKNIDRDFAEVEELEGSIQHQEDLYAQELSLEVKQALKNVKAKHRDILLLAELHDFQYTEIAEMFNVPRGTVCSTLYRVKNRLRTDLQEYVKQFGSRYINN